MSLETYVLPEILSRVWPLCFKCVAREDVIIRACLYVDVILEVCRLFGLHSCSVSNLGRPYSSLCVL
jgi:hypothetical protein